MEVLYWYAAIAWIAAAFKAIILAQSQTASKTAAAFNTLALALIAQNVCEGFSYYFFAEKSALAGLSGAGVIVSICMISAAVVHFTAALTEHKHSQTITIGFWIYSTVLIVATMSGQMVNGVELIGHSLQTTRTPYYPAFSVNIIAAVFTAIYMLRLGTKSDNYLIALRSKLVIMALAPMLLTGLVVVSMGLLSISSSSGRYMPIASTILILVLMKGQKEEDEIISFRLKWLQTWFFARLCVASMFSREAIDLKTLSKKTEELAITEAINSSGENISAAARLLGNTPRQTLARKWARIQKEAKSAEFNP